MSCIRLEKQRVSIGMYIPQTFEQDNHLLQTQKLFSLSENPLRTIYPSQNKLA